MACAAAAAAPLRTLTGAERHLRSVADYTVTESHTVDTKDHEDHTFCGMMFGVLVKDALPIEFLELQAVWVRGWLGPLTVWTTPDGTPDSIREKHDAPAEWEKVYEKEHPPSPDELQCLVLERPVRLRAGESCGLYVHSKLPNDRAIVYDNQSRQVTKEDALLQVLPGIAHLNWKPFGERSPWGRSAWRPHREFVGRVTYGVRYKLWSPEQHGLFPAAFRGMATALLLAHQRAVVLEDYDDDDVAQMDAAEEAAAAAGPGAMSPHRAPGGCELPQVCGLPRLVREQLREWRRPGGRRTVLHHLQLDCLLNALNFCRWDWVAGSERDDESDEPELDGWREGMRGVVLPDRHAAFRACSASRAGWFDRMAGYCGNIGTVVGVAREDGVVQLAFSNGERLWFPPEVLLRPSDTESYMRHLHAAQAAEDSESESGSGGGSGGGRGRGAASASTESAESCSAPGDSDFNSDDGVHHAVVAAVVGHGGGDGAGAAAADSSDDGDGGADSGAAAGEDALAGAFPAARSLARRRSESGGHAPPAQPGGAQSP